MGTPPHIYLLMDQHRTSLLSHRWYDSHNLPHMTSKHHQQMFAHEWGTPPHMTLLMYLHSRGLDNQANMYDYQGKQRNLPSRTIHTLLYFPEQTY